MLPSNFFFQFFGSVKCIMGKWAGCCLLAGCRSAHSLQTDLPRLLHQLVTGVGPTGRRLWARGGEKSLSPDLSPFLLPTLCTERTGVPEPFSQHQLLSGFSSYRTTIHPKFRLHMWSLSDSPHLPLHPALEWKQFLQLLHTKLPHS